MSMFVRLKPYNPRRGYVRRRQMVEGVRFDVDHNWYRIDDHAFAERLRAMTQDESDPESPALFDVCTESEARSIQERERERKGSASVDDAAASKPEAARRPASTVTTKDTRRAGQDWPDDMNGDGSDMIDPDPDGKELGGDPTPPRASEIGKLPPEPESDAKPERNEKPRTRRR
jgi:hypothetical protein